MRTVALVAAAFLLASGMALAQNIPEISERFRTQQTIEWMKAQRQRQTGPQCKRFDGTTRPVDSLVQHEGKTYRCAYVYDEWMTRTPQVVWVPATP